MTKRDKKGRETPPLIPIKLPEEFSFVKACDVRYTRKTSAIIDKKDTTQIACSIKPNCLSFQNCFYCRTMKIWNLVHQQQPECKTLIYGTFGLLQDNFSLLDHLGPLYMIELDEIFHLQQKLSKSDLALQSYEVKTTQKLHFDL